MTRLKRQRAASQEAPASTNPDDQEDYGSSPKDANRLQKVMAAAGVGSRRHCEELITSGRVDVDGKTVTALGTKVSSDQQVRVDGVPLAKAQHVYYLVYKPTGVVSTNSDPGGRTRVLDLLPPMEERLFTVGRLDMSSEGLVLMTNDGELANQLAHPRYEIEKTYLAVVAGALEPDALETLRRGVHLAEGFARVDGVRVRKVQKNGTLLEIVLSEGKNREIRRVLAKVGHKVLQLKRVAIAGLKLADMLPGEFRKLGPAEIRALRKYRPGQLLEKFKSAAAAGPKGPEGKRTPKHEGRPERAPARRGKPGSAETSSGRNDRNRVGRDNREGSAPPPREGARGTTRSERGPRPGGARPAGAGPKKSGYGKTAGARPAGAPRGKPTFSASTTSRPPRPRPPRDDAPRHGTVIGEVAGPAPATPEPVVREARPPRGPGGRPPRQGRGGYAGPGANAYDAANSESGARPSGAGRVTGRRPGIGRPGGGKPTGGKPSGGRPAGGRPSGGKPSGRPGGGGAYGAKGGGRPPREGKPGKGKRR